MESSNFSRRLPGDRGEGGSFRVESAKRSKTLLLSKFCSHKKTDSALGSRTSGFAEGFFTKVALTMSRERKSNPVESGRGTFNGKCKHSRVLFAGEGPAQAQGKLGGVTRTKWKTNFAGQ